MNLDRKLVAYAAGAAVAGIAGAQSAEAAIVYTAGPLPFGIDQTVDINFDQNGATQRDFAIGHERDTGGNAGTDRVLLKEDDNGVNNEGYVSNSELNPFPSALPAGTLIGPDSEYNAGFLNHLSDQLADEDFNNDNVQDETLSGNFLVDNTQGNVQYLGVRFRVNDEGDDRFGWIGIDFTNADDLTGVVTGYAYEDTGAAIEAGAVPEPSAGLALLAVGAAGLLRRKRS